MSNRNGTGSGFRRSRGWASRILVAGLAWGVAVAATPPATLNYQGVLRNASNVAVSGSFDMVFRFFDAPMAGNEILVDAHQAATMSEVVVTGGVFDTDLGGGAVSDGSGPGTYTSLAQVFRDFDSVWLEIQVGGETLAPRVRVVASAYALNASNLEGRPASEFLDVSTAAQFKNGPLAAVSSAPGTTGVTGGGTDVGGVFFDADGSGYGYVGFGDTGVAGYGSTIGGYFQDSNASGYANVGIGDYGIEGSGNLAGAYFHDGDNSGYALVGFGNGGIEGYGNSLGGYFKDSDGSGYAKVGVGDSGIEGYGDFVGGYFKDLNSSGYALVGFSNRGIEGYGNSLGGYFKDLDSSGFAIVGYGDYGIDGSGNFVGGYFHDGDNSGYALVGYGESGIEGYGNNVGGYFKDFNSSGHAYVGSGDSGIVAKGNSYGGFFVDLDNSGLAYIGQGDSGILAYGNSVGSYIQDRDSSGEAYVAYGDRGIWGRGTFAGGTFSHPDTVTFWADVSTPTYKIVGTGGMSFVQNHPHDPDRVIVYSAPEGDEVATYTRGTARLVDGEARVPLGETFAWVTNPDLGLTAHLTPHGEPVPLAVADLSTQELRVVGPAGSDAAFDFLVYGLRIGFEREAVVQAKEREAPLPPPAAFEAKFQAAPEARASTALERFRGMTAAVRGVAAEALDLSGAASLREAIEAAGARGIGRVDPEAAREEATPKPPITAAAPSAASTRAPVAPGGENAATAAPSSGGNPASLPAAVPGTGDPAYAWLPVSETVEAGDLLVLDPDRPGLLRRASSAADPAVAGIAAASSQIIDGALWAPVAGSGFAEVRVDAGYGEIRPADLLTSSPTPGHAMRASDAISGTVIGKALDPLPAGTGTIRILVMPR